MNEVGQLLDRLAADGPTRGASDVFDGARRRSGPIRRHRRRVVAGSVALAVVLVAGAVAAVVATTGDGSRTRVSSTPPPSTPASTPVAGPATIDVGPDIVQPTAVAVAGGRIWVTGYTAGNGPAPLKEFDAATGNLVGQLILPDNSPFAIAIGDQHAVWVRAQQGEESTHLYKVDADRHVIVASIPFQVDGGLAVTADDVWAIDGAGKLERIDPRTAHVVATIPLPGGLYPPLFVSAGPLGVWLTSPYDGSVSDVDATAGTVTARNHVGTYASRLVQLGDSLWVTTTGAVVNSAFVQLSSSGTDTRRTIELGSRILGLTSDGHSLWAATDGGVARVDPVSGAVTPVTPPAGTTTVTDVTADPATGVVWGITMQPVPRLVRLSP